LAKDSTKQLFDKDYNWLDVLLSGLMKAIIRNEMIGGLAFSTASAETNHLSPTVRHVERSKE
jgi:hypothetical protein